MEILKLNKCLNEFGFITEQVWSSDDEHEYTNVQIKQGAMNKEKAEKIFDLIVKAFLLKNSAKTLKYEIDVKNLSITQIKVK